MPQVISETTAESIKLREGLGGLTEKQLLALALETGSPLTRLKRWQSGEEIPDEIWNVEIHGILHWIRIRTR